MSGWENQEAGDWGESIVKAILSDFRITSAPLDPDLGEDYLVEVFGRKASATGEHPKTALIQVKTCVEQCHADEIKVPGIKKTKLMRWSAQQLPVFIIAVAGYSTRSPSFYMKSVDDFLEEKYAGIEVRDIQTESVTITGQKTTNVAEALSTEIDRFHRLVDIDLRHISEVDKRNEYFEVVRRGAPNPHCRKVKHVSWSLIWQASRRPAYFAAMLSDLYRQAHEAYSDLDVPAYVSFHIYRSQYDLTHNMAVARVHWIDERHPGYESAARAVNRNNPKIEYIETHPETRAFIDSKTSDTAEFVAHVKKLAPKMDIFAAKLLAAEGAGDREKEFWSDEVIAEMDELESLWEATPFAPPELNTLQDVLNSYIHALTTHRIFAGKAHWNPGAEKERYRLESAEEIQYYYGSWWVLLKSTGWEYS